LILSKTLTKRLAFVDLETTGGTATTDRITEIGIIEVDESGVREWSSLVNPEMPIPPFIQNLTGISNQMVADAPTFGELAEEIHARLADRIFIAHNARFDHGFLKNEFRRTGHEFRPPVLCTVRLSRKLFPGFARHNLDSLVERHRLQVTQRHRALGDAQLIWQFWQKLGENHAPEVIQEAVERLLTRPTTPSRLDGLRMDELPSSHGVYLFYGENDLPLYIGKANNLRRRILAHFSTDHSSSREQALSQQVERVEWIHAAGELGALLKEAELVKKLMPAHNVKLRQNEEICSWRLLERGGRLKLALADTEDLFFGHDPGLYGLYTSRRKATDAMKAIADAHALCHQELGLEKSRGGKACFASQIKKCLGVCAGREPVAEHSARVRAALEGMRLQPWPYEGAIGILEGESMHVIDGWAYLGSIDARDDPAILLRRGRQRFDRDVYQILQRRLPKLGDRIIPLHRD
jgi:DNA polymerase-3 subunit epsilon